MNLEKTNRSGGTSPPELYNSRIINNWLDYLAEFHPQIDVTKLLEAAQINSHQIDDPNHWFTQFQIDRFHEHLHSLIDDAELSRNVGRFVVSKKRTSVLQQYAFGFMDPMGVYLALRKISPQVTRGADITINKLAHNQVEIINTPIDGTEEKSFQCDNRVGIYEGIAKLFTGELAQVEHPECLYHGGRKCRYIVSWKSIAHRRWRWGGNLLIPVGVIACGLLALSGNWNAAFGVGLLAGLALYLIHGHADRLEKTSLRATVEQQGRASRRLLQEVGIRHNAAVLIQEIGNVASRTKDMQQVMDFVACSVKDRLGLDRTFLICNDPEHSTGIRIAKTGYTGPQVHYLQELWKRRDASGNKPLRDLFGSHEPVLLNAEFAYQPVLRQYHKEFMHRIDAHAFIGIPLMEEGRLAGMLAADSVQTTARLSKIEVRLLHGIADQLMANLAHIKSYKQLQVNEARYRLLADNVSDVIWLLEIDSLRFVYSSPSVLRLLGYTAEELMQITLEEILAPESLELANSALGEELVKEQESGIDPNRTRTLSLKHRRKDGTSIWVEITAKFIRDDHGKAVKIMGISRDIGERMAAHEAQDRLREQLERAHKMEAIGTLAGGVAHDLNNILAGVVSYPDLMLTELPEHSPLRRPILTILKAGKRAAAIVQDLLTLARRGVIVTKAVNLNTIIKEYLETPEFDDLVAQHPGCEVRTHLASDLPIVEGSPVHFIKTIMNLVSNAAEAMPTGGRIDIVSEHRVLIEERDGYERIKPGDYVTVQVKDTGTGISEDDLRNIFEPFYTSKVMGRSGTGLGMSVVWGTVKDHNGYIDVQSEPEKGTTITLFLPAVHEAAVDAGELRSNQTFMGGGESILVVDDVHDQREIAAEILTQLGYRVHTVSSGEDAVAFIKTHPVDMIVLDMIMDPGMDGLDTYRRILQINPNQKAVVATGFSESDRVLEVQRLGASAIIRKPYTIETIGLAVHKALNG